MKRVRVVWFSGTGCTSLVAETFRSQLEARGSQVQMQELRQGLAAPTGDYDLLIVCFAVHACNAPHPVMDWVRRLGRVPGIPAAVFSVSGGGEVTPNLACRVALNRRLAGKGFRVQYEKMLVMPSNWIVATKPALAVRLLEVLPAKLAFILDELAAGRRRRTFAWPGNRFCALLGKLETLAARDFGRRIQVSAGCTGCGWCARRCPVGNIGMAGERPRFGGSCILCLNCLYGCPCRALSPGYGRFIVIQEGFDLQAIKDRVPWPEAVDVAAEARGFLWLGVRRYLLATDDMAPPA